MIPDTLRLDTAATEGCLVDHQAITTEESRHLVHLEVWFVGRRNFSHAVNPP
jgi:hypothetical protein